MSNALPIRRPLRALAAGAIAALAAAGAQAAQRPLAAAVDVALTPAAGDTLHAGGRAVLAWRSADPLAGVEEWEAFLSYDGGATWPVRLTPHLAVDRRRVEVELPPIASADARLLLRFGDEREERELEASRSFAIAAAGPDLSAAPPLLAAASGEAARPGLAGVTWWVDGDREGQRLERREAPARGIAPGGPAFRNGTGTAATGDGERAPRLPQRASNDSTLEAPDRPRPSVPEIGAAAPIGRRLALLSRRNE